MQVRRVRFIQEAKQEFLEEVAYYDTVQPGLGLRFTKALEEATMRALAFPLSGTLSASGIGRVFLKNFPFTIFYRPEKTDIVIFAVAHNARKPGYWKNRIDIDG